MPVLKFWDNTRLSEFKTCPRKFWYRHVKDWVPEGKFPALIFGSSWHAAMDVLWPLAANHGSRISQKDAAWNGIIDAAHKAFLAEWIKEGLDADPSIDDLALMAPRTPQIAKEMLYGYLTVRQRLFSDPTFELLAVERPFAVPLDPNDESIWYVGRLDKIFRYQGRIYCGEHKTTTAYKINGGPFRSDFVDSFSPNAQIDGYLYALRSLYGKDAAGVWVDAALVHKTVHNGFMFIPIERQHAQLDAFLWEAHTWIDQIEGNLEAVNAPNIAEHHYLAAFPKNTQACSNYGGCPYSSLCKALANPAREQSAPMGFQISHWEPFDELELQNFGLKP